MRTVRTFILVLIVGVAPIGAAAARTIEPLIQREAFDYVIQLTVNPIHRLETYGRLYHDSLKNKAKVENFVAITNVLSATDKQFDLALSEFQLRNPDFASADLSSLIIEREYKGKPIYQALRSSAFSILFWITMQDAQSLSSDEFVEVQHQMLKTRYRLLREQTEVGELINFRPATLVENASTVLKSIVQSCQSLLGN